MYKRGKTSPQIAAKLAVSISTVTRISRANGFTEQGNGVRLTDLGREFGFERCYLRVLSDRGEFPSYSVGRFRYVKPKVAEYLRRRFGGRVPYDPEVWATATEVAEWFGVALFTVIAWANRTKESPLSGVPRATRQQKAGHLFNRTQAQLAGQRYRQQVRPAGAPAAAITLEYGVSQACLSLWAAAGAPHQRGKGGKLFFDVPALTAWLAAQSHPKRRAQLAHFQQAAA